LAIDAVLYLKALFASKCTVCLIYARTIGIQLRVCAVFLGSISIRSRGWQWSWWCFCLPS